MKSKTTIKLMNSINYNFEKEKFDTIIFDAPYLFEDEFNYKLNKKQNGIWNKKQNIKNSMLFTPTIALMLDRVFQYAYKNKVWIIFFHKRPLLLSRYFIIWKKQKGGLGWNIGRNAEYIHLINYFGESLSTLTKNRLNEIEDIPADKKRTCSKPVRLYEKLFYSLKSKKIFDVFCGYGNSVIASKNLNLQITAIDNDLSLSTRFEELRKYKPPNKELILNDFT